MRRYPTHRLAHLSDLHVTGDGSPVGGVVDARAQLLRALEVLTSWNLRCDAWVLSGDLSDDGSPASYAWLCSTVLDAAASVGADVVWATGNHDEAAAFRSVFGPGVAGVSGPVNAEHDVAGLRVLVVDSSVPGRPAGTVAPESLAWLGGRLAEPAASGSLLVVHHPPLPPLQDAAWRWPHGWLPQRCTYRLAMPARRGLRRWLTRRWRLPMHWRSARRESPSGRRCCSAVAW